MTSLLRSLLDARAAGQDDQVSQRYLPAARLRAVECVLDALQRLERPRGRPGWLTSQSFCGARRMRAPFAPPRLSEPRKVDADAQAVETSSHQTGRKTRIFP